MLVHLPTPSPSNASAFHEREDPSRSARRVDDARCFCARGVEAAHVGGGAIQSAVASAFNHLAGKSKQQP